MGNDFVEFGTRQVKINFNPRSRVGNDLGASGTDVGGIISIHVPAWGTTAVDLEHLLNLVISIHVPAWGTTIRSVCLRWRLLISIHVPAWGTTRYTQYGVPSGKGFQSTFPRGERRYVRSEDAIV